MTADAFVGTWRLVSFEFRTADGQVHYLFGEDAEGYIMYNADGYMSVAFMTADRVPFAANDPRGGTSEEKVVAMDTFFSYCGRYEVKDDTVIHHIEVSLSMCATIRIRPMIPEGPRCSSSGSWGSGRYSPICTSPYTIW